MTINVNVTVEELSVQGKKYKWKRPRQCPLCNHEKVWGHGFVAFYISCLRDAVFLKRFQCQQCRCVVILKPIGFWKKFKTSIQDIFNVLLFKLSNHQWPAGCPRQRGGHWLKRFCDKVALDFQNKYHIFNLKNCYQLNIHFLV